MSTQRHNLSVSNVIAVLICSLSILVVCHLVASHTGYAAAAQAPFADNSRPLVAEPLQLHNYDIAPETMMADHSSETCLVSDADLGENWLSVLLPDASSLPSLSRQTTVRLVSQIAPARNGPTRQAILQRFTL
jgi:hypothetical protein